MQMGFVLNLDGDVGVGKTTFVREALYALGYDRRYPVSSPTYTYAQDYRLAAGIAEGGRAYAHLDLYRLVNGAHLDYRDVLDPELDIYGLFVEWFAPGKLGDLLPTHTLSIHSPRPDLREYILSSYKTAVG
jgi:tRNA threonylcarbamoyl adenosine modification protein YjeE